MNLDTRLVQLDAAISMELWQEAYKVRYSDYNVFKENDRGLLGYSDYDVFKENYRGSRVYG
jgi:hypothetical protein